MDTSNFLYHSPLKQNMSRQLSSEEDATDTKTTTQPDVTLEASVSESNNNDNALLSFDTESERPNQNSGLSLIYNDVIETEPLDESALSAATENLAFYLQSLDMPNSTAGSEISNSQTSEANGQVNNSTEDQDELEYNNLRELLEQAAAEEDAAQKNGEKGDHSLASRSSNQNLPHNENSDNDQIQLDLDLDSELFNEKVQNLSDFTADQTLENSIDELVRLGFQSEMAISNEDSGDIDTFSKSQEVKNNDSKLPGESKQLAQISNEKRGMENETDTDMELSDALANSLAKNLAQSMEDSTQRPPSSSNNSPDISKEQENDSFSEDFTATTAEMLSEMLEQALNENKSSERSQPINTTSQPDQAKIVTQLNNEEGQKQRDSVKGKSISEGEKNLATVRLQKDTDKMENPRLADDESQIQKNRDIIRQEQEDSQEQEEPQENHLVEKAQQSEEPGDSEDFSSMLLNALEMALNTDNDLQEESAKEDHVSSPRQAQETTEFDLDTLHALLMSAEHIKDKEVDKDVERDLKKLREASEQNHSASVELEDVPMEDTQDDSNDDSNNHAEILAQLSSLLHPDENDDSHAVSTDTAKDVMDSLAAVLEDQLTEQNEDQGDDSGQLDFNMVVSAIQSALEEATNEESTSEENRQEAISQYSASEPEVSDSLHHASKQSAKRSAVFSVSTSAQQSLTPALPKQQKPKQSSQRNHLHQADHNISNSPTQSTSQIQKHKVVQQPQTSAENNDRPTSATIVEALLSSGIFNSDRSATQAPRISSVESVSSQASPQIRSDPSLHSQTPQPQHTNHQTSQITSASTYKTTPSKQTQPPGPTSSTLLPLSQSKGKSVAKSTRPVTTSQYNSTMSIAETLAYTRSHMINKQSAEPRIDPMVNRTALMKARHKKSAPPTYYNPNTRGEKANESELSYKLYSPSAPGTTQTDDNNQKQQLDSSTSSQTKKKTPKTRFYYYNPPAAKSQGSSTSTQSEKSGASFATNVPVPESSSVPSSSSQQSQVQEESEHNLLNALLLAKRAFGSQKTSTENSNTRLDGNTAKPSSSTKGLVDADTLKAIQAALKAVSSTTTAQPSGESSKSVENPISQDKPDETSNEVEITSESKSDSNTLTKSQPSSSAPLPLPPLPPPTYPEMVKKITNSPIRRTRQKNSGGAITADEKERVRMENRERKKRWRGQNMDRNRDNDLRGRVTRRATQIYGPANTPQKMKWIEAEFQNRKLKRLERGVGFESFGVRNYKNPVQSVMPEGSQNRFGSAGNTPEPGSSATSQTSTPSSIVTTPSFFASRGAKAPTPLPLGGIVTSFKLKTTPRTQPSSTSASIPISSSTSTSVANQPSNSNVTGNSSHSVIDSTSAASPASSSSAASLRATAQDSPVPVSTSSTLKRKRPIMLIPQHLLPPDVAPVQLPKPLPFEGSAPKRSVIKAAAPSISTASSASQESGADEQEDKRVRAMGFPPILTGMTLRR